MWKSQTMVHAVGCQHVLAQYLTMGARRMCVVIAVLAAVVLVTGASAAPGGEDAVVGYAAEVADRAADAMAQAFGLSHAEALGRLRSQEPRVALGERLVGQLGGRAAGFWLDQQNDTIVVNVLDEEAAATVQQAGAVAQRVSRSLPELDAIRTRLAAYTVVHTAVGVDVAANQVVVTVASAANDRQLSGLLADAEPLGPAVRVERTPGAFALVIYGGDGIFRHPDWGVYCTAGFNVTGWMQGVLTAGHCTQAISAWDEVADAPNWYLGPSIFANFPGNDFGLIRNDGGQPQPGAIKLWNGAFQPISQWGGAWIGLPICKSGYRTNLTCGVVRAMNVTVSYPEGTVYGLVETSACARPGDSGAPFFAGDWAVGLTSGGNLGPSTECLSPPTSWFQHVWDALNAYGLSLVVQ